MKRLLLLLSLASACAFGQSYTFISTTLSADTPRTSQVLNVASATGLVASITSPMACYVANELDLIESINGTAVTVRRTGNGTLLSGSLARCGAPNLFNTSPPPKGSKCVLANMLVSPWIDTVAGIDWGCSPTGVYARNIDFVQFVPATSCGWIPTTLTQTTTYPTVGGVLTSNSVTSAAAGTDTLSCDFELPTRVTTLRGAVVQDITVTLGSQVVAPTSLGTATLGTITFPVPVATTQTASSATPVTIGGTVTTLGPTTTVTSVTTAGNFLTFKHTFSTAVDLSPDLTLLQYRFPILQSAASAMTLNTAGLFVHYVGSSLD